MTEKIQEITVGEVKSLIEMGKTVKVLTRENNFVEITNYVDKGLLDTFKVTLDNELMIKVSKEHKFFTNAGWIELQHLIKENHKIFCEDGEFHTINEIEYIGKYKIVDITVDSDDHSYFGNGMLNHNTGKSLICASIIAETQKKGGLAVFFDSEFSVDRNFWVALGVDVKNVNYVPFTTVEEFFDKFELCVGAFRKNSRNRLLTIIVDSVTQCSTESEMESDHGVTGYNTDKSIIISKAMRKCTGLIAQQRILPIFTNQLRYNMNAGPFGEKWIVPGGKALPYACSVRIRLINDGKIKDSKTKEVLGMGCQAQVIKNRCGPNYRMTQFDIHYDSGIQDLASWLKVMKQYGIVSGDGRGYKYTRNDGSLLEFNAEKFVQLVNSDAELKEEVYMKVCESRIMEYKKPNSQIIEEEDLERTGDENDDITQFAIPESED